MAQAPETTVPVRNSIRGPSVDQGYQMNWIRDQVMEMYLWAENEHTQRYCEDWLYYYKHYKNYVDQRINPDDYHSHLGVGLAYPIIEIMHSRLMEPWAAGDELVKATAEEEGADTKSAKVQAYVNKMIKRQVPRAFAKHSLFVKSGLLFGRGTMKCYVTYQRPMTLLRRIAQLVQGVRVGSSVQLIDMPAIRRITYDYVDPFDFWLTPGVRFLEESDWTFERGYLTTSQCHAKQESGEWLGNVEIGEQDALGWDDFRMRRMNMEQAWGDQIRSTTQGRGRRPMHRVIEFNGRLPVKEIESEKPKYQDMKVVLLDERLIVDFKPLRTWNAKPPYLSWDMCLDPASERPIGVIEPMEDALIELNDYENIALDNARKILESPLLVDPNSTQQEKLYLGPAEINWIRNPNQSVKALEMKDLPHSFYNQIGFLNDLIQRISGVSDYFGGMNTSDTGRLTKTATGMQLMASLSASRFGPLLTSLDEDYYRLLATWMHESAKLWMTKPENVRVTGNAQSPFLSIGPDELDAVLTFNFNTKSLDPTTEEKRQGYLKLIDVINAMAPMLQGSGYMIDYYEMVRILMDEFDRGAETPKLIKPIALMPMDAPLAQTQGPSLPGQPGVQPGAPPPDYMPAPPTMGPQMGPQPPQGAPPQ